jgi:RNA polymerase sigma-70 factor (ECF subfamily)
MRATSGYHPCTAPARSFDRRIFLLFRADKPDEQTRSAGTATGISAETPEPLLVEAARALDERAWEEIYRRHAQQVYAYIYYRLGDQHTAEDLAADVFVKALGGIKGYVWRGKPILAWLYRIAHNVTVDHRKSAARRSAHQSPAGAEEVEERIDHLHRLDERTDMMRAIRALTEDQQQVIILRFYMGMSNAEVASVMNRPEGAVKALQTRGVKALRRLLAHDEEDGRYIA